MVVLLIVLLAGAVFVGAYLLVLRARKHL
jgi:hypothetical protein